MKQPPSNSLKGKKGIGRIVNAASYSLQGYVAAWKNEAAFRQILILAAIGIGSALYLQIPTNHRMLIILVHMISIIVELLNSAIEAAVDHTSLEINVLAKTAKDMGSAAQFTAIAAIVSIWTITLW